MEKKKMSKSDISEYSRINLTDSEDEIVNKIKKAKTDSGNLPNNEKDLSSRPEIRNLLGIYSSLTDQNISTTIENLAGKNFSVFKDELINVLVEKIQPISKEINKLKSDPSYIDQILKNGADKAQSIASKKVEEIKKIVGF